VIANILEIQNLHALIASWLNTSQRNKQVQLNRSARELHTAQSWVVDPAQNSTI